MKLKISKPIEKLECYSIFNILVGDFAEKINKAKTVYLNNLRIYKR
jgi:hypothetical protein